jgi:galactokinase
VAPRGVWAGVWAAPGRVNLIGEHTDYNDGFVLPFALPLRTYVAASLPDGPSPVAGPQWTASSREEPGEITFGPDELKPGGVDGWARYVAGVVWALREAGYQVPGARLAIRSDVPVGAGLSSSHALECAVLTALCDLGDLDLPLDKRPRLVQRAENEYVGAPTGIMDQTASMLCRAGYALFLDCRSMAIEHIPFDLAEVGLAILVVDTKAPHRHSDGEYAVRRRTCEEAARTLGIPALRDVTDLDAALAALPDEVSRKRVRHVVTENQRVLDTVKLLRAGRYRDIGPLLTASHASMRDDYEITVAEVDTAVAAALDAGAHGARMTGGGFGGCVLALIDASAADPVGTAVAKAFADAGFTAPAMFTAVPSRGAGRVS